MSSLFEDVQGKYTRELGPETKKVLSYLNYSVYLLPTEGRDIPTKGLRYTHKGLRYTHKGLRYPRRERFLYFTVFSFNLVNTICYF